MVYIGPEVILKENIFLLEFLVDEVLIHPGAISSELEYAIGELCLELRFLDNGPIQVCEADYSPRCCNIESPMKNGKSCLFAILPEQFGELTRTFDLKLKVFKKLSFGMKPKKVLIGIGSIPMERLFGELLNEAISNPEGTTVSKTMQDIYPIVPPKLLLNKCCLGDVRVFIRMSTFGKLLVTQFQMNTDENTVFYKDNEGRSVYKYMKCDKNNADCNPVEPMFCWLGCNTPGFCLRSSASCSPCSSPCPSTAFSCPVSSCCSPCPTAFSFRSSTNCTPCPSNFCTPALSCPNDCYP